jgi:protein subunit release factor B
VNKTINKLKHARKSVIVDLKDCVFDAVRGGGPGGQAVAKTSNMCVLLHKPTNIVVKV